MRIRTAAIVVVGALVLAACSGDDASPTETSPHVADTTTADSTTDDTTTADTAPAASTTAPTPTTLPADQSLGPVAAPARNPATARSIYFVLPDRFENGDPANDTAGVEGGPLDHGFDPERRGYHHGGDLAGLTARLPYLADLGIGAIWITPPFTNRWVQGDGTVEGSSSSYHGYWNTDWDTIDPHLGTEDEMQAFIAAAHDLDIHVYFDIVINHTGDVIAFEENTYVYVGSGTAPYLDADGNPFDPAAVAGSPDFPELDAGVSFPYTPVFRTEADATAKSPAWLNDPTLYHNRGNSTFNGESDTWGDFFGLDDLFTEHPRVVDGMIELYAGVIERYDIDGFRVDTMKHVDAAFWSQFAPAIRAAAAAAGKPDFLVFGEVFNSDPISQSAYVNLGVSSTLDFIVNDGIRGFAADGGGGEFLAQAFDDDDWFTDADGNASVQVKFFGNHDEGRGGRAIVTANPGADDEQLLARAVLANDLLFLTRGIPTVYYGDEQGFTGTGGDQLARQDMFASVTPEYADDAAIGTDATPADDNFDPNHPLYRRIALLNELRADHPTLVTGAQYVHELDGALFGFSRIDRDARVEYVVVANSDPAQSVTARVPVLSADTSFTMLLGPDGDTGPLASDETGDLVVQVPPLGTVVLMADAPLAFADDAPTVTIVRPDDAAVVGTPRYRIEAELDDRRYAEVTFAARTLGSGDGAEPAVLGVDDAPPYRLYWSNADLAEGTSVEIVATVDDGSGRLRSDVVTVTLGDRS